MHEPGLDRLSRNLLRFLQMTLKLRSLHETMITTGGSKSTAIKRNAITWKNLLFVARFAGDPVLLPILGISS